MSDRIDVYCPVCRTRGKVSPPDIDLALVACAHCHGPVLRGKPPRQSSRPRGRPRRAALDKLMAALDRIDAVRDEADAAPVSDYPRALGKLCGATLVSMIEIRAALATLVPATAKGQTSSG